MKIAIEPAGPVAIDIPIPGSKSLTNRALICASLAKGTSRLKSASFSDDVRALSGALNLLGIPIVPLERENAIVVHSGGARDVSGHFQMGNAGTATRFFTSLLCTGKGNFIVDGDERMRERPIGGLVDALRALGADIRYTVKDGCPPLDIRSSGLKGGKCSVGGETSSQFVSSLLMAAPAAEGDVEITVLGELASKPYVEITLEVMRQFGVTVNRQGYRRFTIPKGTAYTPGEVAIEADGASANYFLAMAAVTGGKARVRGIGSGSKQGEVQFVKILERMGCAVAWGPDWIEVTGKTLRGVDVDMNDCPDSAQTLACVALFARGGTRVRNVRNLRVKETDRIAALVKELGKLGAKVKEEADGFTVVPPSAFKPAEIATYKDHRMAMSFAVAATAAPGVVIRDPECVSKSYPYFFEQLEAQGIRVLRK
ncbi:MAG TPA: 3-phosphoshikimate 1-carboxyvinyltransferase [Planctomycetota bacterium]